LKNVAEAYKGLFLRVIFYIETSMKFFGRLFSFLVICMVCYSPLVKAQPGAPKTNGRIYGKVVDASTSKSLEFAVVQVFTDSTGGKSSQLLSGALTAANGDFSVDGLPVGPTFLLKINLIGYAEQTAIMSLRPAGFGPVEKDLGNLKMVPSSTLKEIVIEGEVPEMRMEFDKRIFEVDKSAMNAGGTAEDVLRNIPSVQVDNDGNVSVRNSAPQLFVDGRPTNLTIDQIPADAILRVEIITNPSAKYDAGGGGGGIVNIVMKNNRAQGYNGSARFGVDMRARINAGLDVNARQGKFNFFMNGNLNQRKSISTGYTDRENLGDFPTQFFQEQTSVNTGYFGRGTLGIDWFADNRNTFTLSQSLNRGSFNPLDEIRVETDTLYVPNSAPGIYNRISDTSREFQNIGTSLLFKHLFAKEGTELTADLNFNAISSVFDGDYSNIFNETNSTQQKQTGNVRQRLYTSQLDYVNKLTDKTKIEIGARGAVREYASFYENFFEVNGVLEEIEQLQVNYAYFDQVYAAYGTYSKDAGNWKYQLGLRAESSTYTAELIDTTISFRIQYPISLFPSAYITKVISEKSDLQLALNRRIARPSFMQLSPFTDYSDSLNVSRGNPELRPEFTHAAELSYQNNFSKKNTFLATAYFRYTTGVTVRQQNAEFSPVLNDDIVVTSYYNAASSTASGLEFILKSTITKWFDLTGNLNLYRSSIDGTNIDENLTNTVYSYWAKVNATFKMPKAFTLQMNGEYVSRKALEVGSSERGGNMGGGQGGPGGGFGGSTNTVQGFVRPNYSLDLSLKKDFFKDKNLSVTVSVQDVLRSRINYTYSESPFFVQDTFRRRDPQFWRINLIWRFGKMDATLFKRKNTRSSGEGMEG
jgi:outer membrane receptor protein involved in Fe transport